MGQVCASCCDGRSDETNSSNKYSSNLNNPPFGSATTLSGGTSGDALPHSPSSPPATAAAAAASSSATTTTTTTTTTTAATAATNSSCSKEPGAAKEGALMLEKCRIAVDGGRFILLNDLMQCLPEPTRRCLLSAKPTLCDPREENVPVSFTRYTVNRNAASCLAVLHAYGADLYEGLPEQYWRTYTPLVASMHPFGNQSAPGAAAAAAIATPASTSAAAAAAAAADAGGDAAPNTGWQRPQDSTVVVLPESAALKAIRAAAEFGRKSKRLGAAAAAASSSYQPQQQKQSRTATKSDGDNSSSSASSSVVDTGDRPLRAFEKRMRLASCSKSTTGDSSAAAGLIGRAVELGHFQCVTILTQALPRSVVCGVMSQRGFVECLLSLRRRVMATWDDMTQSGLRSAAANWHISAPVYLSEPAPTTIAEAAAPAAALTAVPGVDSANPDEEGGTTTPSSSPPSPKFSPRTDEGISLPEHQLKHSRTMQSIFSRAFTSSPLTADSIINFFAKNSSSSSSRSRNFPSSAASAAKLPRNFFDILLADFFGRVEVFVHVLPTDPSRCYLLWEHVQEGVKHIAEKRERARQVWARGRAPAWAQRIAKQSNNNNNNEQQQPSSSSADSSTSTTEQQKQQDASTTSGGGGGGESTSTSEAASPPSAATAAEAAAAEVLSVFQYQQEYFKLLLTCDANVFAQLPKLPAEDDLSADDGGPFFPLFTYAHVALHTEFAISFTRDLNRLIEIGTGLATRRAARQMRRKQNKEPVSDDNLGSPTVAAATSSNKNSSSFSLMCSDSDEEDEVLDILAKNPFLMQVEQASSSSSSSEANDDATRRRSTTPQQQQSSTCDGGDSAPAAAAAAADATLDLAPSTQACLLSILLGRFAPDDFDGKKQQARLDRLRAKEEDAVSSVVAAAAATAAGGASPEAQQFETAATTTSPTTIVEQPIFINSSHFGDEDAIHSAASSSSSSSCQFLPTHRESRSHRHKSSSSRNRSGADDFYDTMPAACRPREVAMLVPFMQSSARFFYQAAMSHHVVNDRLHTVVDLLQQAELQRTRQREIAARAAKRAASSGQQQQQHAESGTEFLHPGSFASSSSNSSDGSNQRGFSSTSNNNNINDEAGAAARQYGSSVPFSDPLGIPRASTTDDAAAADCSSVGSLSRRTSAEPSEVGTNSDPLLSLAVEEEEEEEERTYAAGTLPLSWLGLGPALKSLAFQTKEVAVHLPPMHAAFYAGNLRLARMLLALGGTDQLHIRDSKSNTLMHHARAVRRRLGKDGFVRLLSRLCSVADSHSLKAALFHSTNDEGLLPGERALKTANVRVHPRHRRAKKLLQHKQMMEQKKREQQEAEAALKQQQEQREGAAGGGGQQKDSSSSTQNGATPSAAAASTATTNTTTKAEDVDAEPPGTRKSPLAGIMGATKDVDDDDDDAVSVASSGATVIEGDASMTSLGGSSIDSNSSDSDSGSSSSTNSESSTAERDPSPQQQHPFAVPESQQKSPPPPPPPPPRPPSPPASSSASLFGVVSVASNQQRNSPVAAATAAPTAATNTTSKSSTSNAGGSGRTSRSSSSNVTPLSLRHGMSPAFLAPTAVAMSLQQQQQQTAAGVSPLLRSSPSSSSSAASETQLLQPPPALVAIPEDDDDDDDSDDDVLDAQPAPDALRRSGSGSHDGRTSASTSSAATIPSTKSSPTVDGRTRSESTSTTSLGRGKRGSSSSLTSSGNISPLGVQPAGLPSVSMSSLPPAADPNAPLKETMNITSRR